MKALAALLASSAVAYAAPSVSALRVAPQPSGAPSVEVWLEDATDVAWSELRLDTTPVADHRELAPAAVAFVYSARVLAGDDEEYDPNRVDDNAGRHLGPAVADLQLARRLPPGSTAIVVSYATDARLRFAGPADALTAQAFAIDAEDRRSIGSDLQIGVRMAIDQLSVTRAANKLIIVVGDGHDTDDDAARRAFAGLRGVLDRDHVAVEALIVRTAISAEGHALGELARELAVIDPNRMLEYLIGAIDRLTARRVARFDGAGLTWDDASHPLIVTLHGVEIGRGTLVLSPRWSPPNRRSWWIYAIAGAIVMVGVGIVVARRRSSAQPPSP